MENKSRNVKFVLTFICGKCLDVIYGSCFTLGRLSR